MHSYLLPIVALDWQKYGGESDVDLFADLVGADMDELEYNEVVPEDYNLVGENVWFQNFLLFCHE